MLHNRFVNTEGVVTRHNKLGESDMIVTLLTPSYGLLRAVAKGMRRTKSHLNADLDILQHSKMFIRFGRNLHSITQTSRITDFSHYAKDVLLYTYGCYITEMAESFVFENEPAERLFNLLVSTLKSIPLAKQKALLCFWFNIHLLQVSGFAPQVQICVVCNEPLDAPPYRFLAADGGIACSRCAASQSVSSENSTVSENVVQLMRFLGREHWRKADAVQVPITDLRELSLLLKSHIKKILGNYPRSGRVLTSLLSGCSNP